MFWIFVLVVALALVLLKLGMLSVWVSVFSIGLQVAMFVIAFLLIALIWHWVLKAKSG